MMTTISASLRAGCCVPRLHKSTAYAPARLAPVRIAAQPKEVFPGPQEERESAHEAFMHAMESAKPVKLRLPGLQQFAAAIWERRRRIPSTTFNDPLDHIFTEFDEDGDGHLTAAEIATALNSRGVEADVAPIQEFINAIDTNNNGTVERSEFADFIFHLAVAELKSTTAVSLSDLED